MDPLSIRPEWHGTPAIVAASGPSLTPKVIYRCRMARWFDGWRVLAVNDAAKAMPWADAVYAADAAWWRAHAGLPNAYEHCQRYSTNFNCDAEGQFAKDFPNVRLIGGIAGGDFSRDATHINFGEPEHSGFQAINLALLLGARKVVLVGFDCRFVEGRAHFFGDHPPELRQADDSWLAELAKGFDHVTVTVPVVNATPGSRITKFPQADLDEALFGDCLLHRNRAEPHAATG